MTIVMFLVYDLITVSFIQDVVVMMNIPITKAQSTALEISQVLIVLEKSSKY